MYMIIIYNIYVHILDLPPIQDAKHSYRTIYYIQGSDLAKIPSSKKQNPLIQSKNSII